MKPTSIRVRITTIGILTLALVLGLGAWVTVRALGHELERDVELRNQSLLESMAEDIAAGVDPAAVVLPRGTDWASIVIIDADGRVVNDTHRELAGSDGADALTSQSQLAKLRGGREQVITATTPSGKEVTLLIEAPLKQVGQSLDKYTVTVVLLVPFLVAFGGSALWVAVGAALRPVKRMTDEANGIAPTTSGERLRVPDSGDEITDLAVTLNNMLNRLDAGLVRQRQFVSDASHELRSPLTAIKGASDLISTNDQLPAETTPIVATLQRSTKRLELVLDDLTQLADGGVAVPVVDVDLDVVVLAEVASVSDDYPAISIEANDLQPCVVQANEVQLGRAIQNLVSNAARHAATQVRASGEVADGFVRIVVDDDGPGVHPDDRERIFDRFVRADEHRSRAGGGSGLGLAIVASIAESHGGTAFCTDSPLGGAQFVLQFPAATSG